MHTAEAVLASTKIGSVPAYYSLLSFVISSRKVININPLSQKQVYRNKNLDIDDLNKSAPDLEAFTHGLQSQIGRRNAYRIFVKQQRQLMPQLYCETTYFLLLSNY